jgi:hypothetical protein
MSPAPAAARSRRTVPAQVQRRPTRRRTHPINPRRPPQRRPAKVMSVEIGVVWSEPDKAIFCCAKPLMDSKLAIAAHRDYSGR